MKLARFLVGYTGPWFKGTDCALLDDDLYAVRLARGEVEPVCGADDTMARHALCQAAARLDVAITSRDPELDELADHYGVRSTLKRARG